MKQQQKIMIVGGCFDILHPGHINFLQEAKKQCNYLILLLESDKKVSWLKGEKRPVNSEQIRKNNLEKLIDPKTNQPLINEIIILPFITKSEEYQKIIEDIENKLKTNPPIEKHPKIPEGVFISMIQSGKTEELNAPKTLKFIFGITKNDRNQVKNDKIHQLSAKMNLEVLEVNELLPEHSTSKILTNTN
jgi:cytidyltransferase-like protein